MPRNRPHPLKLHEPSESEEQQWLMDFCHRAKGQYPELALLFHIPNGGHRNKIVAAKLKREGVMAGVPDLFLPVAREGQFGFFIEMKRRRGGRVTAQQQHWIQVLRDEGYRVDVCRGWGEASDALVEYISGARTVAWDIPPEHAIDLTFA